MEGLQLVDIKDTVEMNMEIQQVMEQRFDLSMSATITMLSLREKLRFLSDSKLTNLLSRDVDIPDNVDNIDNVTAMVLREIIRLFGTLRSGHQEINVGEEQFRYYWRNLRKRRHPQLQRSTWSTISRQRTPT
jgi:hypothetical protein